MSIEELTIRKLRNALGQSDFEGAYNRLLLDQGKQLEDSDIRLLFKLALLFLNFGDYSLAKLGYRIILRYSNLFKEYEPLYDVSINKGYIPVSRFIETTHFSSEETSARFFNLFNSAFKDNFLQNGIYLSYGQRSLVEFAKSSPDNYVLVAPTSYGKSDIIINRVLENIKKRICILVPSKALLAQTKRRLLNNGEVAEKIKRIITHPEMYKGTEQQFVSVLTQERLLRLLQNNPELTLDLIMVDEAHNLLRDDNRAILLAQVLLIAQKRNADVKLNFFTPFIADGKSLESPYAAYKLDSQQTTEYLKVERFYYIDLTGEKTLFLYDQFTDRSLRVAQYTGSEVRFILKYAADKNIVYLNKPKDIEALAKLLSQAGGVQLTPEMQESLDAISDFLHPQYNLLDCIRSGIAYHHGGMPDVIRLYVENLFTKVPGMRFIVTNSTLLEGVNIPAEKIFILDNRIGSAALTKAQFKNLIGRVCRFSEVFNTDSGNLDLLEPAIYLIKGRYARENANIYNFLRKTAKSDLVIEDKVENLLLIDDTNTLSDDQQEDLHDSLQYLENIERDTVDVKDVAYATSVLGELCFKNNVYDFDILQSEQQLLDNYENTGITEINSPQAFMDALFNVFIEDIDIKDENFKRLRNEDARKFYSMILEWRSTGSSYKQMIAKFLKYWRKQTIIYAGRKWGEIPFDENNFREFYVDLRTKSETEKINLAIHRIKEEQDYVDNNLIKYIEIYNDLGLMDTDFYEKIKYGTSDKIMICLLKNGFSLDLAKCITQPAYANFLTVNLKQDEVFVDNGIIAAMEIFGENQLMIFEVTYHVS